MLQHADAIFENGLLRPEVPLLLANGERVSLQIQSNSAAPDDLSDIADMLDHDAVDACKAHSQPAPSLEEVRAMLSVYQGELSELIIQERNER
jgi:predicted DNA-binding antitoxin AbrB/MazE fold protein